MAQNPIGAYERLNLGFVYGYVGRFAEAEAEVRTTLGMYPDYTQGRYVLGTILLRKGEAAPAHEAMVQEPSEVWRLAGLPLTYQALGQTAASDEALNDLISKYGGNMAYQIAEAYAYRGDADRAFKWLERAYRQRDTGMAWYVRSDPLLTNIKADPRYSALLLRMELPAE